MDAQLATQFGLSSGGVAVILVVYKLFKAFKGHLLVSKCCGRRMEVGFDVQDSLDTPPRLQDNPLHNSNGTTDKADPVRGQAKGQAPGSNEVQRQSASDSV